MGYGPARLGSTFHTACFLMTATQTGIHQHFILTIGKEKMLRTGSPGHGRTRPKRKKKFNYVRNDYKRGKQKLFLRRNLDMTKSLKPNPALTGGMQTKGPIRPSAASLGAGPSPSVIW